MPMEKGPPPINRLNETPMFIRSMLKASTKRQQRTILELEVGGSTEARLQRGEIVRLETPVSEESTINSKTLLQYDEIGIGADNWNRREELGRTETHDRGLEMPISEVLAALLPDKEQSVRNGLSVTLPETAHAFELPPQSNEIWVNRVSRNRTEHIVGNFQCNICPCLIAIPTSAAASVGESLMPSPTVAATFLPSWNE
ncbi:unnamed protein product [Fraxinus pennsylvanica]|uniref:Uncharacterized protein n=1 Tax=Fraxinus pennsylvanica TaxID=56036 RepID=A0AAD2AC53_9LAMI|nr:unnamed protein product [Fraxinus pennsylvanica]